MRRLVRSFAVLLVLGAAACGKRPIAEKDGGGGAPGDGGHGGAAGVGASAGASGGATAGSNGGATAGSNGGATAGSNGGATAGTGGAGASAGAGTTGAGTGGASAGGTGAGSGGASAGTGGANAGSGGASAGTGGATAGLGPLRLLIFYTRWGTSYPEWWPTGSDRNFTMSAMMQALEPHKNDLIVVSGLANVDIFSGEVIAASANDPMGDAMFTLLTARPAALGGPGDGPSLDTAVGDCGGAAGPPLRLAVGQFGFDDNPGISFADDGTALRGERDPHAAAMRVLGHDVTAPDPNGDINANYPGLGAAHMNIAVEALATSKACAVTLMWGDHVSPAWLGITGSDLHELSHDATDLYSAVNSANSAHPGNRFVKLQTWYALQFASLLDRLRATPLGAGTLLDQSVVVWISESGAGPDHSGAYIPVVIAGRGGGRLDAGRFIEIKPHLAQLGQPVETWTVERTQGDLLQALANLWGITYFGDPRIARQSLKQILKP